MGVQWTLSYSFIKHISYTAPMNCWLIWTCKDIVQMQLCNHPGLNIQFDNPWLQHAYLLLMRSNRLFGFVCTQVPHHQLAVIPNRSKYIFILQVPSNIFNDTIMMLTKNKIKVLVLLNSISISMKLASLWIRNNRWEIEIPRLQNRVSRFQWQIQIVFLLMLVRERTFSFPICYLARTRSVIVFLITKKSNQHTRETVLVPLICLINPSMTIMHL